MFDKLNTLLLVITCYSDTDCVQFGEKLWLEFIVVIAFVVPMVHILLQSREGEYGGFTNSWLDQLTSLVSNFISEANGEWFVR